MNSFGFDQEALVKLRTKQKKITIRMIPSFWCSFRIENSDIIVSQRKSSNRY